MPSSRPWTVTPHAPLARIDDNIWEVRSPVPGLPGADRRMSIVRRLDGSLIFYNAVPVDEPTLAAIASEGRPEVLVVPNPFHMIDAPAFAEKLAVRVIAPRRSVDGVRARMRVDGVVEELPEDASVKVGTVNGFKTGEAFLVVTTASRRSLIVADVVTNARRAPGVTGFFMHLVGFTGARPKLPPPVRMRVLRDRPALRRQLDDLAQTPDLHRIIPSHGDIHEGDAAATLREIAAAL